MKPRRQRQNLSGRNKQENIERFLAALVETGTLRDAARIARIAHTNVYNWKRDVPGFRERLEAAQEQGKERVGPAARDTLFQMGVIGVLEDVRDKQGRLVWDPVDKDGNVVPPDSKDRVGWKKATRRVRNVKALELTLKYLYPGQFGDIHKLNVEGEISHTLRVEDLSDDDLRRIASAGRN